MSYRDNVIAQYRNDLAEHNKNFDKAPCSNGCGKQSDVENALCTNCERRLVQLCRAIDPAIKWLDMVAGVEASDIAAADTTGSARANPAELQQATTATLLADELSRAATKFARQARLEMVQAPAWHGQPGSYLVTVSAFISRQVWAPEIIARIGKLLGQIRHNWGIGAEPARLLEGVPCPRSSEVAVSPNERRLVEHTNTLYLHPARYAHQPIAIVCEYVNEAGKRCGWQNNEDAQTWLHSLIVLAGQARRGNKNPAKGQQGNQPAPLPSEVPEPVSP